MSRIVKYILIVIVIVALGIGIIFINENKNSVEEKTSEKEKMDQYYYENRDKVDLEMGNNVESKGYELDDGKLLIEVDNLNDYPVDAKAYIEFFDENGDTITIMDDYISNIEAGKKSYGVVYLGEELCNLYKTYRVFVVASYDPYLNSYYDNVKDISFNKKKKELKFRIDAKTNKKISVEFGLLFYDEENHIIDFTEECLDVKANKDIKEEVYFYKEYHEIEVVLLRAYSYD